MLIKKVIIFADTDLKRLGENINAWIETNKVNVSNVLQSESSEAASGQEHVTISIWYY